MDEDSAVEVLDLSDRPDTWRLWWEDLRRHFDVLLVLARKDFQTRYKRASLGIVWAVVVPILQAAILAVVFSHVVRTGGGPGYSVYVMSGIIPYVYFSTVIGFGVVSIVEGATLTDKVWFPRILLAVVPVLSNLLGLILALLVMIAAMPVLHVHYGIQMVLLVPALALLVLFSAGMSLVLSALNVYFRDVKFLVQAALIVWMYLTPVIYYIGLLHHLKVIAIANPLTGPITLFHMATVGSRGEWVLPVLVSVAVTAVLLVVGLEAQRRHDRLFVDLL